jgi:NAD(P)-dependent dehydrogenase (short-subunit alcohol dehydrogenase family)
MCRTAPRDLALRASGGRTMLMSDTAFANDDEIPAPIMAYPQLAGKRVLVTGVTSTAGVDIVRAFAEHKTQLVIEMAEQSEAMQALAEIAAQSALDLTLVDPARHDEQAITTMARQGIAAYGGVDLVVNIIEIDPSVARGARSVAAVEAALSALFLKACLVGRIAANRMRLTHAAGVILNVAVSSGAAQVVPGFEKVARATLEAMTRGEAQTWAQEGIRFNAVAPGEGGSGLENPDDMPTLYSEPDVAQLALFLATGEGKNLSGLVFDRAMA